MEISFKSILVPFDNSKSAFRALDMAIMFAKKCESRITMVHVVTSPNRDQSEKVKETMEAKKVETGLEFLFLKQSGRIPNEIMDAAEAVEADLIVMGTHGASGFQPMWIGTNAFRVVSLAHIPVITIRETVESTTAENILLPIDEHKDSRQKVPMGIALAKLLGSKVHVLEATKYDQKDVSAKVDRYGDQVVEMVKEHELPVVENSAFGVNVVNHVLNYAEDLGESSMIIMMSEAESSSNFFLGSNPQQLVNHSTVPVMTLHTKMIKNIVLGY